jgi:5-methylcytosine-specific restriction protein A
MGVKVPTYRPNWAPTQAQQRREYDRHRRDKAAKAFYHTGVWLKLRPIILSRDIWCVMCLAKGVHEAAVIVDHIETLHDRPDLALDPDNLRGLCSRCHTARHKREDG